MCRPRIDSYRFPKGEDVRKEWAGQVGRDGFTILEAVFAPGSPRWLRKIPAVQVLRRAWVEQYHRDGEGVRRREGKDLPPGRRRLSSVRRTRIRRTRYTGLPKTHLGHIFAATAINIIRLDAWLTETPLGPTRTTHLAQLDLAA